MVSMRLTFCQQNFPLKIYYKAHSISLNSTALDYKKDSEIAGKADMNNIAN